MASNPQHEPTMEEILASIRKIISEDSSEQPAGPAPAAAAAPAIPPEADVLELTQELPAEPPPAPRPEPVRAAPTPPAPKPAEDIVFQAVEEPAPRPAPAPVSGGDDIFSDKTRKALDDTFAKIPAAVEPVPATPVPAAPRALSIPDGASVEAVFERAVVSAFDPVLHQWMDTNKAELLNAVKPLIREWMDEHFPALLEGAVRNEVERVVRSRGGK
jgi:cell pole-organizing protein PopZ